MHGDALALNSRQHDRRAGRLAAFEVAVDLLSLSEWIRAVDLDLYFAGANDIKEVARRGFEIGARRSVGGERRARDIQRAFGREDAEFKRRHGAGGVAEADEQAERAEA